MICRNHVDISEGVRRCTRCQGEFCPDCLVVIQDRPFCAMCKNEQLLDVRSGVERHALPLASVWKRFAAYIIDNFIIVIPFYAFFFAMMIATRDAKGEPSPLAVLAIVPMIFAWPVYDALMMQFRNGQTLGKMALDVRVVRADGSPLTAGNAWGRAAMKFVLSSCLSLIDFLPAFFTAERTTLHDMIASTRVVDTR